VTRSHFLVISEFQALPSKVDCSSTKYQDVLDHFPRIGGKFPRHLRTANQIQGRILRTYPAPSTRHSEHYRRVRLLWASICTVWLRWFVLYRNGYTRPATGLQFKFPHIINEPAPDFLRSGLITIKLLPLYRPTTLRLLFVLQKPHYYLFQSLVFHNSSWTFQLNTGLRVLQSSRMHI
jgi:hypothetical protein